MNAGNGDPRRRCVSYTGYLAQENSKVETRERREKNNNKRGVRNIEEENRYNKENPI